jgi:hypothetical protein
MYGTALYVERKRKNNEDKREDPNTDNKVHHPQALYETTPPPYNNAGIYL